MTRITKDKMRVGPWVGRKAFLQFTPEDSKVIGLERAGEIVAGVIYTGWNGRSICCHIAVQGLLTPSYLAAIFHYPFIHCGAEKIIAQVAESNEESRRFCKKLGFTEECRIADSHPDGAIIIYTMTREACRFIEPRYIERLKVA